jgi:hypothetical protein
MSDSFWRRSHPIKKRAESDKTNFTLVFVSHPLKGAAAFLPDWHFSQLFLYNLLSPQALSADFKLTTERTQRVAKEEHPREFEILVSR